MPATKTTTERLADHAELLEGIELARALGQLSGIQTDIERKVIAFELADLEVCQRRADWLWSLKK